MVKLQDKINKTKEEIIEKSSDLTQTIGSITLLEYVNCALSEMQHWAQSNHC